MAAHAPTDGLETRLIVQHLGLIHYSTTLRRMKDFTAKRTAFTVDQLWLLEHHPVYTLGHAARREHVLDPAEIPVVQSDRGGQVTYHGPGQLVAYVLIDLQRKGLGVRDLVSHLEGAVIELLAGYGIDGKRKAGAPGVYVAGEKIASLGLRVRRGCSFHGLSLNVDMDLAPFDGIDPCGYAGLRVTQLARHGVAAGIDSVATALVDRLAARLGYTEVEQRMAAPMESPYPEPDVP